VSFEDADRMLAPDDLRQVMVRAAHDYREKLASVTCPIHGTAPQNVRIAIDGTDLRVNFEDCCSELAPAVRRMALKNDRSGSAAS
jgi:hypothetical protein